MTDWASIIDARRQVKAIVDGWSVVGDLLDTPPAAGAERSWLQAFLADARSMLQKIVSLPETARDKARAAATALKGAAEQAAEKAKTVAADLVAELNGVASDAGSFLKRFANYFALFAIAGLYILYQVMKER